MKFCCAPNAAIKYLKIARKKTTLFTKYFQQNRQFKKKMQIFNKHKVYFQILEVLHVILATYLPVGSINKAMNQLFRNYENNVNFIF